MLKRFDYGGVRNFTAKGLFTIGFGQRLVHKLYEKECYEYRTRLSCESDLEYTREYVR